MNSIWVILHRQSLTGHIVSVVSQYLDLDNICRSVSIVGVVECHSVTSLNECRVDTFLT